MSGKDRQHWLDRLRGLRRTQPTPVPQPRYKAPSREGLKAATFHQSPEAWRQLKGIAFEHGINGMGGMPCDIRHEAGVGPRKLRTTTLCGLVFATLSDETPPIEDYLGADVLGRIRRVLRRPVRIMGRFTQALPNNWKLYVENVKDTYHASLLHLFFGTFRISRLTQGGGVLVSPDGGRIAWVANPATHPTADRGVHIGDLAAGEEIEKLKPPKGIVLAGAFDDSGQRLALGTSEGARSDGVIYVYDLATRNVILRQSDSAGAVIQVALSPDGRKAAAAFEQGSVKWWPVEQSVP